MVIGFKIKINENWQIRYLSCSSHILQSAQHVAVDWTELMVKISVKTSITKENSLGIVLIKTATTFFFKLIVSFNSCGLSSSATFLLLVILSGKWKILFSAIGELKADSWCLQSFIIIFERWCNALGSALRQLKHEFLLLIASSFWVSACFFHFLSHVLCF